MRVIACVALSLVIAGCGKHRVPSASAVPQAAAATAPGAAAPSAESMGQAAAPATKREPAKRPPADSLEVFMRKVRALSAEARPGRVPPTTLESTRPRLAAAAAAATFAPSPETLRAAAAEYALAGVHDRAFEYLNRSIALAPRDAAGYDALAGCGATRDSHSSVSATPIAPCPTRPHRQSRTTRSGRCSRRSVTAMPRAVSMSVRSGSSRRRCTR